MRELNLNDEVTIKLNERGLKRTTRNIETIQNDPNLTNTTKIKNIELWREKIDKDGYLTASLGELIDHYTISCFETQIAIMHKEEDLPELNLNTKVTIKLNEKGIERTKRNLAANQVNPNLTEKSKQAITELWESRIDSNGYLTIPLNELMNNYKTGDFESQIIVVQKMNYDEESDTQNIVPKAK